ncbi:hypothetical protein R3P38DRAFT_3570500 [Favolaschia claudopus]|uniref:Myb-like domain-containing protein n=1 Tax=Favolaschia claudopus TaxID=2862362 RepID=A0AAW0AQA5_9AGAR
MDLPPLPPDDSVIDPILLAQSAAALASQGASNEPQKQENAVWTCRNETTLLDYLLEVMSKSGDGLNFKEATWKASAHRVNSDSREKGGPKTWQSCKSKFQKVAVVVRGEGLRSQVDNKPGDQRSPVDYLYTRGDIRYDISSGHFASNAEPERGVAFSNSLNLNLNAAFRVQPASASRNLIDAAAGPFRVRRSDAFERDVFSVNAEPNLAFRFEGLLNLNAERASGSVRFGVRTDFRTELSQH